MSAPLPSDRRHAHRWAIVVAAALAGIVLVLVVSAATPVFRPATESAASYDAGYAAGHLQGVALPQEELDARTAVAFTRGQQFQAAGPADRFAAALLAMHAVLSAQASGGPFDQGYAAGWADALAGTPPLFDD